MVIIWSTLSHNCMKWKHARENLIKAEEKYKMYHNRKINLLEIKIGDNVFLLKVGKIKKWDNTGLQGFLFEKLRIISGVIFDAESESRIRISPSRQDSVTTLSHNFQDCDKKESESYLSCYKCGEIGFKMGNFL